MPVHTTLIRRDKKQLEVSQEIKDTDMRHSTKSTEDCRDKGAGQLEGREIIGRLERLFTYAYIGIEMTRLDSGQSNQFVSTHWSSRINHVISRHVFLLI